MYRLIPHIYVSSVPFCKYHATLEKTTNNCGSFRAKFSDLFTSIYPCSVVIFIKNLLAMQTDSYTYGCILLTVMNITLYNKNTIDRYDCKMFSLIWKCIALFLMIILFISIIWKIELTRKYFCYYLTIHFFKCLYYLLLFQFILLVIQII